MTTRRARPTKLRLTFNFRKGTSSRSKIRGFASALAEEVAINASEQQWLNIRDKIEKQVEVDARREISRAAQLYKQLIIGIPGDRTGPYGKLTPASAPAKGLENLASFQMRGAWAPRSEAYLKRKAKKSAQKFGPDRPGEVRKTPRSVGHRRWFLHDRILNNAMGAGRTWSQAFGPVKVDVKRIQQMSIRESQDLHRANPGAGFNARFKTGESTPAGQIIRVHVANIRVSAMEEITPRMLPALASGNINDMADDGRATGLIQHFPKEIARNLAGSAQTKNFVPYRHTIEPFLGFLLTRAIPNAVARRIQAGLTDSIQADKTTKADKKFGGASGKHTRFDR